MGEVAKRDCGGRSMCRLAKRQRRSAQRQLQLLPHKALRQGRLHLLEIEHCTLVAKTPLPIQPVNDSRARSERRFALPPLVQHLADVLRQRLVLAGLACHGICSSHHLVRTLPGHPQPGELERLVRIFQHLGSHGRIQNLNLELLLPALLGNVIVRICQASHLQNVFEEELNVLVNPGQRQAGLQPAILSMQLYHLRRRHASRTALPRTQKLERSGDTDSLSWLHWQGTADSQINARSGVSYPAGLTLYSLEEERCPHPALWQGRQKCLACGVRRQGFSLRLHFRVHDGFPHGSWHRPGDRRTAGGGGGAGTGVDGAAPVAARFLVKATVSKATRILKRSEDVREAAHIASCSGDMSAGSILTDTLLSRAATSK